MQKHTSALFRCSRTFIRCFTNKMATADINSLSEPCSVIGVCQMTCTGDKSANFQKAKSLVERCKALGAKMVFLPEACDFIADSKQQSMDLAESLQGETIGKYRQLAKELSVWISIGGFHQKPPDLNVKKLYNTHVMLDDKGNIQGTYCKSHMFDLDIPGKIRLCESDYTLPGNKITPPIETPAGKVALAICYDMRFPEMSLALRNQGAEILTYPSAFTIPTGMAHWHVLLRNRAIESQCYVVAAAQTGWHNEKRSSYGHSLIVDPWGTVLAECGEGEGVCVAEIDLEYLQKVRLQMPLQNHRRTDLYGDIVLHTPVDNIDSWSEYEFGHCKIGSKQVFYRTALSFAFVNLKPVQPGHVLVASIRKVKRFNDLEPAEMSDLFRVVSHVSKVVEKHFKGTSLTLSVQDGPEAGQTVEHVHVHVLPRKAGDFAQNDDVYKELETHDDHLDEDRLHGKVRTVEQMNAEAAQLRAYFS
ncbi:deaminated glutathione amidase-like [Mercenaria mercenaria]|uniref:deaminated glutathione amidase-like n=1 Tax=Mercenaria mercenaria TaxID=6596 RepID=UPI00234ED127|nr:deaminated glutathione amidase-like [Mercenaria mercenaria]XP_053377503.1 deaminated glutathione amidase-like [Mercenaria mercenaria]